MNIFSLIVNALSAAICLCVGLKIAVFAYLTYGERVSWWWCNGDDRVKVGWLDFALCAIWMFGFGIFWLICVAYELLK